jgi:16S rRNA (cytidine1402-2'-O)-methyltransferase
VGSTAVRGAAPANRSEGILYVVGTPIGNLEDMTFRAVRILGEVDALACEDTRVTRRLLQRHAIPRPTLMFPYHEHNAERAGPGLLKLLAEGRRVALCSDAGMPGISDPGHRLIAAAHGAGHRVEVIPGPSAAVTALVASGLPSASFTFLGFPPRKRGKRQRLLGAAGAAEHTLILFESPHRLGALLHDARAVLGDRPAAVALELTKLFETIVRGSLTELAARFAEERPRGEVTVVIAGWDRKPGRRAVATEDGPD